MAVQANDQVGRGLEGFAARWVARGHVATKEPKRAQRGYSSLGSKSLAQRGVSLLVTGVLDQRGVSPLVARKPKTYSWGFLQGKLVPLEKCLIGRGITKNRRSMPILPKLEGDFHCMVGDCPQP